MNNGQGSPKNDSFVATQIRVLEGSKEYPLKTHEVIAEMKKKFAEYQKEQAKAIDEAMDKGAKLALNDQKATGPREKEELMYVTWLPDSERLRVHFRVKLTDGSFKFVDGPIRPGPGGKVPPIKGGVDQPPPGNVKIKTGTAFAVEFGVKYDIDKSGKLVGTEAVPFSHSTWQLQMPAGVRGPVIDPPPAKE